MLLSCDVCLCLCCLLLSQVVAVSDSFRPVSSSAPVVSGGAVATERSPLVCEGELCGASSSSVRPWDRPCLSPLRQSVLYSTSCCHRFDQVWPIEAVEFLKFGCV